MVSFIITGLFSPGEYTQNTHVRGSPGLWGRRDCTWYWRIIPVSPYTRYETFWESQGVFWYYDTM